MRRRHPAENRRRQSPRDLVMSLVLGIVLVGYGAKSLFTLPDYGSVWTGIIPYVEVLLGASLIGNGLYGFRRLRAKPIPGVIDPETIILPSARTLPTSPTRKPDGPAPSHRTS